MEKSLYFIRRGHANNHRNGLEESIAKALAKFDKMLIDSPKHIGEQMRTIVLMRNQANPRCKPASFSMERNTYNNKQDFTARVTGLGGSTVWMADIYLVQETCYVNEIPAPEPMKQAGVTSPVPVKKQYREGEQLALL